VAGSGTRRLEWVKVKLLPRRADTSQMSSSGTYQMKIDSTLSNRRNGEGTTTSALAKYREHLVAHLVMSLADLRLKKRVTERTRRQGKRSH
jgi:hypothetical protein